MLADPQVFAHAVGSVRRPEQSPSGWIALKRQAQATVRRMQAWKSSTPAGFVPHRCKIGKKGKKSSLALRSGGVSASLSAATSPSDLFAPDPKRHPSSPALRLTGQTCPTFKQFKIHLGLCCASTNIANLSASFGCRFRGIEALGSQCRNAFPILRKSSVLGALYCRHHASTPTQVRF